MEVDKVQWKRIYHLLFVFGLAKKERKRNQFEYEYTKTSTKQYLNFLLFFNTFE